MNHLAHLIRWDVRRLRLMLGLWTLIVIAYTAVVGLRPYAAAEVPLRESLAVADSLLWLTILLMTMALVSSVIHGHPTVGTDAYWMTRPIPPDALLASKLLLLAGALLAIPAAAESILLAVNRMPVAVSLGVLAQTTSIRMVLAILLIVAAAMTRNLAHFALLCGGVVLSTAAAIGITASIMLGRMEDQLPINTSEHAVEDPSALVVFNALFVVAAVAMLAVQYRTRLKRRSLPVGAAAILAALVVAWLWPVPFLRHRLEVPEWAHGIAVNVDPATINTNTRNAFFATRATEWGTVNGQLRLDGISPGWTADVSLREASLRLADGVTLQSPGSWRTYALVNDGYIGPEAYERVRQLLGVRIVANRMPVQTDPPRRESLPTLFVFRRAAVAQHVPARGFYRATIAVNLTQLAVIGAVPLRPGASYQAGGYRIAIDRIGAFDYQLGIAAREASATSMWERRPWADYRFYLRNAARGEAIAVSDFTMHRGFPLLRFLPIGEFSIGSSQSSGFSSRGIVLSVPPRYGPQAPTFEVDEAWLQGAELVIIRRTEEGWVERTIGISDFPIGQ